MIKLNTNGRLGNVLIQNIAISLLSKKFDYKTEISNTHYCLSEYDKNILGLNLNCGKILNQNFIKVNNSNFLDILKENTINYGLECEDFFETEEFVLNYKNEILNHFNLKYENENNNDVFIHVRLGDLTDFNPGIEYYREALKSFPFNKGYISSDTINHPIISNLIKEFNLSLINISPVDTINFAKNFKNIVLSRGSFSWWIGFLSKSKNIIYPKNYKIWVNEIFVFSDWKGI